MDTQSKDDFVYIDHEEVCESKNVVCDQCGKTLASKDSLKRHKDTHGEREKTHICATCNKKFTHRYLLQQHVQRQHRPRTQQICPHCGTTFASSTSMNSHIRFKHLGETVKCTICLKHFKDKYALRRHSSKHTSATECNKCSKKVKDHEQHPQRCEGNNRSYVVCDICGKEFISKRYLRRHTKNKHLEPYSYKCNCGKTYSYPYALDRHKKICNNA